MKVLVVGAGGYIGSRLCEVAHERDVSVERIGTASGEIDAARGCLSPGFCFPSDVDVVVYLSQSPHYRDVPDQAGHVYRVNSVLPVDIANHAVRAGVKKFIYASSGNVYASSFEPYRECAALRRNDAYALSKIHGEEALAMFSERMDVTALRIFGVYGPSQPDKLVSNLYRRIEHGSPVLLTPAGDGGDDTDGLHLSLCYVYDLIDIIIAGFDTELPPVLNVAGEQTTSIRELAELLARQVGRPCTFETTDGTRPGNLVADISLLKSVLNPAFTDLASGLRQSFRRETV